MSWIFCLVRELNKEILSLGGASFLFFTDVCLLLCWPMLVIMMTKPTLVTVSKQQQEKLFSVGPVSEIHCY